MLYNSCILFIRYHLRMNAGCYMVSVGFPLPLTHFKLQALFPLHPAKLNKTKKNNPCMHNHF